MIRIPNNLFQPKIEKNGTAKVILYALNVTTIGISPESIPDWGKVSLYRKTLIIHRQGSNWIINLPRRVTRFYQYDRNTVQTVGINNGKVLITISRR